MKLGYDLTIEQTQKLVMTPEIILAIKILQFNTQELDAYVQEQLLINPVLEAGKPVETESSENQEVRESPETHDRVSEMSETDWREFIKDRGYDDISYRQWEYTKDNKDYTFEHYTSSDITLPEHLLFQLQFVQAKRSCRNMGRYIIESLDENGYMTLSKDEIARKFGAPAEKVGEVLGIIQGFDPPGVGAADIKECLLIQLGHINRLDQAAISIVNDHLEDLAANRLGHISKELGKSIREIQEIGDLIRRLEPKPGRQFASQTAVRYITPDVLLEKTDVEYVVTINESSTPRLMVSPYYEKLLAESQNDAGLSKYLASRLNSAVWLIKSIEQRKQTIYNVVSAVVKYQKDYFDKGPKHLKTLTLKQIADEVGIHESTVSRSINGKYIQTPRGVFEIKYFFTSGVASSSGESVSSKSIKAFIKEIIESEDPKAPYSDRQMADVLEGEGFKISRRTVAKYRDEINVLSSSKRKRY
ncbi:MAG: RNA polymerase factor sigma-54 [Clostridiales bacterium]|nr:RNA polymerase factor sigma-54 [Clostridiales bacterium]